MGEMIVGELAVHGWDLAVATVQRLERPADLLPYVHDAVLAGDGPVRTGGRSAGRRIHLGSHPRPDRP
jgi:hypothetical protein